MGKHVVGGAVSVTINGKQLILTGSVKLNLGGEENERIEANRTTLVKKKWTSAEVEG